MEYWQEKADQARLVSTLPNKPNQNKVNEFLIDFYERYFYGKRDFDSASFKAEMQKLCDKL